MKNAKSPLYLLSVWNDDAYDSLVMFEMPETLFLGARILDVELWRQSCMRFFLRYVVSDHGLSEVNVRSVQRAQIWRGSSCLVMRFQSLTLNVSQS